jgi:hypothetical protein
VSDAPTGTGYAQVVGGNIHGCAREDDGSPICWGYDNFMQVTDTPINATYSAITAGGQSACGLTATAIECWGWNPDGQAPPSTAGSFVDVQMGGNFTCARSSDESITCFGADTDGQLGAP